MGNRVHQIRGPPETAPALQMPRPAAAVQNSRRPPPAERHHCRCQHSNMCVGMTVRMAVCGPSLSPSTQTFDVPFSQSNSSVGSHACLTLLSGVPLGQSTHAQARKPDFFTLPHISV